MTNQQLYLAVGVPVIIYLLGFTLNVFVIVWQAHSLEKRIDSLRNEMMQALLRVEQVLDARLKHLEER